MCKSFHLNSGYVHGTAKPVIRTGAQLSRAVIRRTAARSEALAVVLGRRRAGVRRNAGGRAGEAGKERSSAMVERRVGQED
jgi:hypothetical protein